MEQSDAEIRVPFFHGSDRLVSALQVRGFDSCARALRWICGSAGRGPESDANLAGALPYEGLGRVFEGASGAERRESATRNCLPRAFDACSAEVIRMIVRNSDDASANGGKVIEAIRRSGHDVAQSVERARLQADRV